MLKFYIYKKMSYILDIVVTKQLYIADYCAVQNLSYTMKYSMDDAFQSILYCTF